MPLNDPNELTLEVLDRLPELERVRSEWRAVWERDPRATPFQSPDWLLPWTRHLWGGGKLCVLVCRHQGAPVGVAPFFLWGFGPGRDPARRRGARISFLGSGISDHLDLIAAPEFALAAAGRVLRYLADTRSKWRLCDLQELPPASPLLAARIPSELARRTGPCGICPVLRLPGSFDELLASVDAGFRHNLRTAENRLRRAGAFEFWGGALAAQASEPVVADLFRLHQARWRDRGQAGVLAAERLHHFHRETAARLADAGALRLHALRLNGETIAVQYNLCRGRRHYFYLSGFDPAHRRLSPGGVLLAEAIRGAIAEGATEIDFLRQGEEFKYQWGARDTFSRRLCLKMRSARRQTAGPAEPERAA